MPPAADPAEDQLSLWDDRPAGRGRTIEVLPGAVLVEGWLDLDQQRALAGDFRRWAEPPAGLRHPRMPTGHLMTLQAVCLGWHWQPYRYSATADDTDGAPVKPLPPELVELSRRAVAAAYGEDHPAVAPSPRRGVVSLYARRPLGLHQDGDEAVRRPVVTISPAAHAGSASPVDRRPPRSTSASGGALLVFGGPTRLIYHGVPHHLPARHRPDSTPPSRVSTTVRQTGCPALTGGATPPGVLVAPAPRRGDHLARTVHRRWTCGMTAVVSALHLGARGPSG
jgi:alkylated DNA repair protein (DNA oxidative demethylase)